MNWVSQSFAIKTSLFLMFFSFSTISLYAYKHYTNEKKHLSETITFQSENLSQTLSLVIIDDVKYANYFQLWSKINIILKNNQQNVHEGILYFINEIAVVDLEGNVLASTDPIQYPLLTPYDKNILKFLDGKKDLSSFSNIDKKTTTICVPIYFEGENTGNIITIYDISPSEITLQSIIKQYLIFMLIISIIIIIISIYFSRWIGKPFNEASQVLDKIGSGKIVLNNLLNRKDEFYHLGVAITSADKRLHQNEIEIRNQHDTLEELVKARTHELELALKELETFSYSVSHDLRSPLRSINGMSHILLEDYGNTLDNEGKEYLLRIQKNINCMGQLIDDLLNLSRVSRRTLNLNQVNLGEIANNIVSNNSLKDLTVNIIVNIPDDLYDNCDRNLIHLVLQNLFDNAIKYSKKVESATIEFGVDTSSGQTTYYIKDNGCGFDMAFVDKIFKPFQRLHKESDYAGTGIGLATVAKIIARHYGKIWVESEVDKGTTFYFTLKES